MITKRKCENCGYTPIVCNDNLKERRCNHCGGLLKIIMKEVLKE